MATDTAYRRSAETMREGYEASKEVVREYPLSAALTVFGLGFGVGLALGVLLGEEESRSRYDTGRLEQLGRQFLNTLSQVVPDAVSRRLP
jgi:hypothetical protein